MNFFRKSQQVSPRKHSGTLDLESLLPNPKDTPPKPEPLQESHHQICGLPVQLVAGGAYCVASASMVLLNKAALSSFDFHGPTALLFFQCLVCCILVKVCSALNFIRLEPWNIKIVQLWLPVNVIFVGMIWTSFFALKNLGVPMATVLKNLTNLFTILGDYTMYGKVYGGGVWASLALMCASAVCGSITDLAFDLEGYLWQLVNCLFTASYSLYLRGVMDRVVSLTVNKTRLDEFSMVFYNNVLSLPLIGMLMWWYGELDTVMYDPALRNPMFIMAACSSALVAFGISFASLWFLSTTTATSYSLVGSLNKIPVALIGLVAFDVPWNLENLASILVGLIAGIVFVKAKSVPINK
ncbi:GDP-mannose transporter, golgi apparatus [Coccomyxa subellipsoidea C-169]|uniref:GDP-mannose transporter, golgi apparatus n=1 Tax=Coccomyxa subellipsoidea (strain C-169) TaxID=574566 RepID=I0Z7H0_COCSC|nr:GDP-mannose transporter, golgi apparatus [Coccomyxa subellipsoidea C-169]EIE26589.1 GDP-mannose transporter, golgi apparatus [Coccomyxa subellipsoidea C-169]|eukprot:XP_005651133.1 GDP-mannose transporter, golgi apparatus [Coccomyxa subellipsoidea C-169]